MNDQQGGSPIKATCRDMALKSSLHSFTFSLKDFDIAGFLGDGAHGSVFLACERRTNFICVLKCISKSHLVKSTQEALLRKEIELQAHLKHPHIACMYTWFHTNSHVFFVMEYCSNGDLFSYLNDKGPFTEQRVAEMLFEIIWAIRTCHDKRIAHLDLKPENVLVNHEEKCKLADFGLSAHIGSKHKKKGISHYRGTHDYWSPEQCARHQNKKQNFGEFDQKTDIWTLGILAFELKFGRPPFGSTNEEKETIIMNRIQDYEWHQLFCENSKKDEIDALSVEFKDFLNKCLDKNPQNRPTAEALIQHPFIFIHNKNRPCIKAYATQPRGKQGPKISHKGFNEQEGTFLTPTWFHNK